MAQPQVNRRIDNTREVVFKKDFKIGKSVIYKKGSKHYIHKKVVDQIAANGAEFEAKEFDFRAEVTKAKKALEDLGKSDKK